jgi:hypothetical protein
MNPYERPMFNAKTSIEFIPILNGQDDIGVEGFIKRVREARSECKEKHALLRLILTKRIWSVKPKEALDIQLSRHMAIYSKT